MLILEMSEARMPNTFRLTNINFFEIVKYEIFPKQKEFLHNFLFFKKLYIFIFLGKTKITLI